MTKSELLEAIHAIEATDSTDLEIVFNADETDYEIVSVFLGQDGKIVLSDEEEPDDDDGEEDEGAEVIDVDFRKAG